jgi:hypothetical protein
MKLEVTAVKCAIPLTSSQWLKLQAKDYLDCVAPTLEAAGALRGTIEYDGHFGRCLYFIADNEADGNKVLHALEKLISSRPSLQAERCADGCVR